MRFPALEEFERSEIPQRLMRAHGVVDVFPAPELGIKMPGVPVLRDHLIELRVVRAMRAFDVTVELARRGPATVFQRQFCCRSLM